MADQSRLESLLVADIGSVTTKVGLVDHVSGEFRFVASGIAKTTSDPPDGDVAVGLRSAIRQIEVLAGRRFLAEDSQLVSPERPGLVGVDAFGLVTSAAVPLRVAIVGLSRELSVASAIRAVRGTHATLEATLALDEMGGRWLPIEKAGDNSDQKSMSNSLENPVVVAAGKLAASNPDVIILVGGVDGGATSALYDLANLITSIVSSRDENVRPVVVFAGNRDARAQIAARVGQVTQLRVVDNVCPALDRENSASLQRELELLYTERKIAWLPGLNAVSNWTPVPIIPSSRAFENVVRFLARRYGLNVLGADIGGAAITIVAAHGESYSRVVRADLGIGQNIEHTIESAGIEQLTDWLPMEITQREARVRWLNQGLRPGAIPASREDAQLAQAAARAALETAVCNFDLRGLDLIVLTGGLFAGKPNLGTAALLVLDALQPRGVFTLAVDPFGLAPALGGLAALNVEAAASVIERDGFVTLGTVLAPVSNNRDGQIDMRVRVQPSGGGEMNLDVQHGSLELIPLMLGQKASIQVRPTAEVYLGSQPQSRVFNAEVEGGALGLVIDARGRPIVLPRDAKQRQTKVQQWYWDIGGEGAYA